MRHPIISYHISNHVNLSYPIYRNGLKGDKLVKIETEPRNSIILSTFPIYRNCTRWQAVKLKKSSQNLFARDTGGKLKAGLSLFIDKDDFQRSNMICKTPQECETALTSQFCLSFCLVYFLCFRRGIKNCFFREKSEGVCVWGVCVCVCVCVCVYVCVCVCVWYFPQFFLRLPWQL